jgi:hypothetical protein
MYVSSSVEHSHHHWAERKAKYKKIYTMYKSVENPPWKSPHLSALPFLFCVILISCYLRFTLSTRYGIHINLSYIWASPCRNIFASFERYIVKNKHKKLYYRAEKNYTEHFWFFHCFLYNIVISSCCFFPSLACIIFFFTVVFLTMKFDLRPLVSKPAGQHPMELTALHITINQPCAACKSIWFRTFSLSLVRSEEYKLHIYKKNWKKIVKKIDGFWKGEKYEKNNNKKCIIIYVWL